MRRELPFPGAEFWVTCWQLHLRVHVWAQHHPDHLSPREGGPQLRRRPLEEVPEDARTSSSARSTGWAPLRCLTHLPLDHMSGHQLDLSGPAILRT